MPSQIVEIIHGEGFPGFKMHHHTNLWKQRQAKNPTKGFGTMVAGKYWHWYESWIDVVRKHCQNHTDIYS